MNYTMDELSLHSSGVTYTTVCSHGWGCGYVRVSLSRSVQLRQCIALHGHKNKSYNKGTLTMLKLNMPF